MECTSITNQATYTIAKVITQIAMAVKDKVEIKTVIILPFMGTSVERNSDLKLVKL